MKNNKVVLYVAMSLDGYIARLDGAIDWLLEVEGDGGDNGYGAFYQTVGTVVMGRKTYEEILTLSEEFLYVGKPCYILSRSEQPPAPHVMFTSESVETLIPKLKEEADGDVWIVGGGQIVQACLEKGLIDEIEIAITPNILGEGIPLFPQGTVESKFHLVKTEQVGQLVIVHYTK